MDNFQEKVIRKPKKAHKRKYGNSKPKENHTLKNLGNKFTSFPKNIMDHWMNISENDIYK